MPSKLFAAVMYGQGGQRVDAVLSLGGIDRLVARIRALSPLIECPAPFTWDKAFTIAERIKTLPADCRVVIGGASLGANESPRAAAYLKARPVDLLFGIQPSLWGVKNLLTPNVKRAVCFVNPWWSPTGYGGFGGYEWQRAAGNRTTVLVAYQTFVPHPGGNAESVQGPILNEIKKLLAS